MTDKQKVRTNVEIGKALGFKKCGDAAMPYWEYPEDWEPYRTSAPEYHLPDFVKMLHDHCTFISDNPIIPRDYGTHRG